MPHRLPKLMILGLLLSLMVLLVQGSIAAMADDSSPTEMDAELVVPNDAPDAFRNEKIYVGLELADAPVVKTFINAKAAGAAKADALTAQKVQREALKQAQAPVVAAVTARVPTARIVGQHQDLVNSVTVRLTRGEVRALQGIRGVTHIHFMPDYQKQLSNSVPYIGAERVRTELGITGRGARIGVIDTGIDYTHRDFGGPGTVAAYEAAITDPTAITETVQITNPTTGETVTTRMFPSEKIPGGYDFIGDNYTGVAPNDVLEPDPDPIDFDGHGTHVSGIVLGMGVPNQSFNGSIPADTSFDGTTVYHGVAPAAQLYFYKVFSAASGGAPGEAILNAVERAMDPNQNGDMADHLDAINMSLGASFGPNRLESLAINRAVDAGIAFAISAGNSADVPYIVGSPAIADKALSVASAFATGPVAQAPYVRIDAPASLAGRRFLSLQQAWAPSLVTTGPISGEVVYIGLACPGQPLLADPRGKIALVIRGGGCANSLKAATASAAGAIAVIGFDNAQDTFPPDFAYGGGNVTVPTVYVTNASGVILRNAAQAGGLRVTLSMEGAADVSGYISGFSSRGPSIVGSSLKPDITGPGSSIFSAAAGSGDQGVFESGTSMSAPHIAGALGLMKQAHPGWTAQELEAGLTNTANPNVRTMLPNGTTPVVSVSRQGAGMVDVYKAVRNTTVAYAPDQVGSVSFGFKSVVDTATETKTIVVTNKGTSSRTYNLSFAFTDPATAPAGSTVTVSPSSVTLAANETRTINVTINIAAAGLPPYGVSNAAAADPITYAATFSRSEISGAVRITEVGGAGDSIQVPVYTLARRASAVDAGANSVSLTGFGAEDAAHIRLTNTSAYSGTAEVFALVGADPNETNVEGPYDVQYVGVRTGIGTPLPSATTPNPTSAPTLDFGIKTYGARTLMLETRFNIFVDANRDGTWDYWAFNDDVGRRAGSANGVNATYVINLRTGRTSGPYFRTDFLVNSSNAILKFPAAALGVNPDNQAFDFAVLSWAWYVDAADEDLAPDGPVTNDGYPVNRYTINLRDQRFRTNAPSSGSITVAPNGATMLDVYANARGFLGAESVRYPERGLLLLYQENAPPDRDADVINLTFPFNFRVEQQTLTFNPTLSGYIVNRPGELGVQFNVGDLWTGVDNRPIRPLVYNGIVQFNLGTAGSTVEFEEAVLELTGLDASYMDPRLEGRWGVDMLTSSVDTSLGRTTYGALSNATADARLTPLYTDADLGPGRPNTFTFDPAARAKLQEHVRTSGRVTFRTFEDPLYQQGMQLFAWDGRGGTGADIRPPVLRVLTVTRVP